MHSDSGMRPRVAVLPRLACSTFGLLVIMAVALGADCDSTQTDPWAGGVRDKYRQPFASTSIWNMPIGSGAVYVPARIEHVSHITVDEEYWIVTNSTMPRRPLYTNGNFYAERCETTTYRYDVPVPDDLVIHDSSPPITPNNVAAILLPDARTILQMNPLSRCEAGGPVTAGFLAETVDIYGEGIGGGHGGSHLSSIGGSIRRGELVNIYPIRHALKVNLSAHRLLSRVEGGFRWPATSADADAFLPPEDERSYNGSVPELRMGALLAIPRHVDLEALGLKTIPARKLAWTLQNYGAYVVDSTGWDASAFNVEKGVAREFRDAYGLEMEARTGPWYEDAMRLFAVLAVVDNNTPSSIGGGGVPLQPLAPPIGN